MKEIDIKKIKKSTINPRQDLGDLTSLVESIKARVKQGKRGIIQPVIVREVKDGYELVIGSRRHEASKIAGLKTMPCLIENVDTNEALVTGLIENDVRKDLLWIERATAYSKMQEMGMTQEEIAYNVHKSRTLITEHLASLRVGEKNVSSLTLPLRTVQAIHDFPEEEWKYWIDRCQKENLQREDLLKFKNNAKKVISRIEQLETTHPEVAKVVKEFWYPLRYGSIYRDMEQEIGIRVGQPKRVEYFIPINKASEEEARQYADEKHGEFLEVVTKSWYRMYIIPKSIDELRSRHV